MKLLGEGSYSFVYSDGEYAIKVFKDKLNAISEINLIKSLTHPNIIKIIDIFLVNYVNLPNFIKNKIIYNETYICIKMIKYKKSLKQVINSEILSNKKIIKYLKNIMSAINYMHSKNIIHCDIKPENILIDKNTAILIDFSIASFYDKFNNGNIQTPLYRDPEINFCYNNKINFSVDIWSFGCIVFEMICKKPLIKMNRIDHTCRSALNSLSIELNTITEMRKKYKMISVDRMKYIIKDKSIIINDYLTNLISFCIVNSKIRFSSNEICKYLNIDIYNKEINNIDYSLKYIVYNQKQFKVKHYIMINYCNKLFDFYANKYKIQTKMLYNVCLFISSCVYDITIEFNKDYTEQALYLLNNL